VVHELDGSEPESPLFPYAAGSLGTGASMAFRTQVLRDVGAFDPALGGGTPARAGEDLSPFVEVLLAGWRLVYEPAAIARHFHRRTYEELRRVMLGYGSGLSAYLTRTAVRDPRRIPGIARRALRGARFLLDPGSPKNARKRADYPAELTRLELQGILWGPAWYVRSVLAVRRARRSRGTVTARIGLPGRHNAENGLVAAGAALAAGAGVAAIVDGLGTYTGVGRRLELKGEVDGIVVLDDYGHHPTAMAATFAAVADRYPGRRLWAVYEPLTFHRTAAMLGEFAEVLARADRVVIAEIHAGRDPDTTITSAGALADAVNARGGAPAWAPGSVESTADWLAPRVERGDVVLVMGGGRSYMIAERLLADLRARSAG